MTLLEQLQDFQNDKLRIFIHGSDFGDFWSVNIENEHKSVKVSVDQTDADFVIAVGKAHALWYARTDDIPEASPLKLTADNIIDVVFEVVEDDHDEIPF